MKVLMIGGTGLISTAITRELLQRGDDVTLFNRGITAPGLFPEARWIAGDRKDYARFEAQISDVGPFDCVVDMCCFVPEEAESVVRGLRGRTSQLVFCSTVDVYTKPAARYPIREDEERRPSMAFPYAYHKAASERILFAAHDRGDLNVTVLRPAYTYGEGRGILHSLRSGTYTLDRLRKGLPLIVHGDGTSLWTCCHRDDVARAFVSALGNEKTYGKGYHVTGEEWLIWDRYHQLVAEAIGAPAPELVHMPTDLLVRVAPKAAEWCALNFAYNNIFDNTAAREDLGFEYAIPWSEGVRRVVSWLDAHGEVERSEGFRWYDRIIEAWTSLDSGMILELSELDL